VTGLAMDTQRNMVAARPGQRDKARLPGHATATLLTIVTCQFMIGLDATVVNIALPKIRAALHFTPTSLAWVVSAYILAFGGLLLLGGRTGDILGRRRMFMSGLSLFAVASLFGGLATSMPWLLSARIAQGTGAAFAAPSALALVTANFREGKERDRALAVVTGSYAASLIVGLIAGGMITAWASWRWVMFMNVPIAIALLVLAPLFISEAERHRGRFDLTGAVLSIGAMTALVYGFLQTASSGWHGTVTIAMFPVAAVLLTALAVAETRAEQPIVPLRLLRDRRRSASYLNLLILTGPMAAMNFFVTQLLQNVLGFSPLTARASSEASASSRSRWW
jgi:MFS family permease